MLVLSCTTWLTQARHRAHRWFSCQMATNKSSPHLQIRHNFFGLLLDNWNCLHPIVISLIHCAQWNLHPMVWGTSPNSLGFILWKINLSLPWKLIFSKNYHSNDSPPNFLKLISQSWRITEQWYFTTLWLLDSCWTHFWKHCIYYKKDGKVGSQNFGYQPWFCTRLLRFISFDTGLP